MRQEREGYTGPARGYHGRLARFDPGRLDESASVSAIVGGQHTGPGGHFRSSRGPSKDGHGAPASRPRPTSHCPAQPQLYVVAAMYGGTGIHKPDYLATVDVDPNSQPMPKSSAGCRW